MSEDFDGWNPMNDDFQSVAFNSYSSGQTAAHMPHILGSEFCETRRPSKLYIEGFPLDLTESGLKNFLLRIGCKISSVKIVSSKSRLGRRFSFVDFESAKEAQKAVELIRSQNLYKLCVSFSSTQSDRQKRESVIEKEKQSFRRLLTKQFEMKEKINIGNCSAINSKNSSSNGDTSSMSPIHSEAGSHESSHLDLLSPLARSDKLLKVLERPEDNCSFCSQAQPLEHLHFILSEQQVIDPTQLPPLIDVTNVCQACGRKAGDLKLCSQCRVVTYCDLKCQTSNWPRHRLNCRPDSTNFLNFNSTIDSSNSLNGNSSVARRIDESIESVAQRSQSEKVVPLSAKLTKTTPQIVNTVRMTPKESTPIVAESRPQIDEVDCVPKLPAVPEPVESVRPKEVIKPVFAEEIAVRGKQTAVTDNKPKVHPIKLKVETEVLVDGEEGSYLCFGRSPFDFYLQKASAPDSMDIFADEIYKKMKDFPQLTSDELKQGALCGGIYSADDSCYRARIVDKVNDNTYALYFIDYGNTEPVEKKDIKRLPEIFFSCKAQAIHCSLDGIFPKNKTWSNEAIALFGVVGESNEYSKVKIFEKTNEGIYKIDLINAKGDSIRKLFVDKDMATFVDDLSESGSNSFKTPSSSPERPAKTPIISDSPVVVQGSPKVTFNKSSINDISLAYVKPMPPLEENSDITLKSYIETVAPNSTISFMVTNALNPDEFQYFGTIFESEIQILIEGLATEYPSNKQTVIPKVGDIVVVQGSDDEFYRSYVLSVELKGAQVFMFDSGFIEVVTRDKIYKMDEKFQEIPVYGVMLLSDNKEGARLIELSQTSECTIEGVLMKKQDLCIFRKDNICIQMLDFKSCLPYIKRIADLDLEEDEPTDDPFDAIAVRQLQLNKWLEAFALYQDPNEPKIFYVAADADIVPNLMSLCAKYGMDFNNNINVNPLPRNVYLVRSNGDEEWYRAVVYSATEDTIKVKYIDFGNEEEIDSRYVMELHSELTISAIPPLAIKCKVESTKLKDDELKTKIQNATEGAYLLKVEVRKIEDGFHSVKVK